MNGSSLGFIIMIMILITDVILYAIHNSKIVETATPLALTLFLNRLLLFIFGGDYWVYGLMALYFFYAIVLSVVVARKRFPFENDLNNLNLDNISESKSSVDISKIPEALWSVITTIYAGIFTVLYVVEFDGVPLPPLNIDDWEYPYYINAVFGLLLVCSFFCLLAIYRLFIRKKKRIEPKILFFMKNHKFDTYWIFLAIELFFNLVIGLIGYWITDYVSYFIFIFLITVYLLLELNAALHYILNDYDILQDVKTLNAKIDKHNERIGDI